MLFDCMTDMAQRRTAEVICLEKLLRRLRDLAADDIEYCVDGWTCRSYDLQIVQSTCIYYTRYIYYFKVHTHQITHLDYLKPVA